MPKSRLSKDAQRFLRLRRENLKSFVCDGFELPLERGRRRRHFQKVWLVRLRFKNSKV